MLVAMMMMMMMIVMMMILMMMIMVKPGFSSHNFCSIILRSMLMCFA